jgi:hypothetical protein
MTEVSPEIGLMLAPRATYSALMQAPARASIFTALRRPLLVAVVIGVAMSIAATRRATPALVAGTTISWSYVVLLQVAVALVFIARGARRTVGLSRALDLFFAGHAPWSLLVLAAAAWAPSPIGRPFWPLTVLAAGAIVVTSRIVFAFFREVLGMSSRDARRMTVLQQSTTWALFVVILWVTSALTPRVLELLRLS